RAARRQVLGDGAPLAAGAQHIHDAVDDLALIGLALAPAMFGGRDERLDQRPLGIGEIARVTEVIAVVAAAVLDRPHGSPPESAPPSESQQIQPLQALPANRFKRLMILPDGHLESVRKVHAGLPSL